MIKTGKSVIEEIKSDSGLKKPGVRKDLDPNWDKAYWSLYLIIENETSFNSNMKLIFKEGDAFKCDGFCDSIAWNSG